MATVLELGAALLVGVTLGTTPPGLYPPGWL
jgi:hypothetical protein